MRSNTIPSWSIWWNDWTINLPQDLDQTSPGGKFNTLTCSACKSTTGLCTNFMTLCNWKKIIAGTQLFCSQSLQYDISSETFNLYFAHDIQYLHQYCIQLAFWTNSLFLLQFLGVYFWQWIGYGCLMFFYLCKLAHKLQELVHVHVSA